MTLVLWIALLLVMLVLQASLLPIFFPTAIRPDLLLILVICSGLLAGKERAVGVGFFAGLLQDLISGNLFGLNIIAKLVTGYATGLAERKVFKESFLLPLLAVTVASLFHGMLIMLLLMLWGYKLELTTMLLDQTLPSIAFNAIFSIPVHKMIYRLEFGRR